MRHVVSGRAAQGDIVETWTLRGRDAKLDNTQRVEMFRAESKGEM